MKEIWDLFNADGEPLGITWERGSRDSMPNGAYHKVVEIWVKVEGKILLTRRHPDKWGGLLWESSGGAVLSGESVLHAAVRELCEETGIAVSKSDLLYLGRWHSSKAMVESFAVAFDVLPPLKLQPTEVVDAKLVTPSELEAMRGVLTDGTRIRFEKYKERLIK